MKEVNDMPQKKYTDEEARERKNQRQKEYEKKTNRSAKIKYSKEKTRRYVIEVIKSSESDIYEKLEKQTSKAGYIKSLIRKDIDENGI